MKFPRKHTRQSGFTLLEVLVAIVILSVGLLGLAGLQAASLRNNHSAFLRSQATLIAYDMLDRMRANRDQAIAGSYDLVWTDTPPSSSCGTAIATPCTAANMAGYDQNVWLNTLAQKLPAGDGQVTVDTGIANIEVRWTDRDGTQLVVAMASQL